MAKPPAVQRVNLNSTGAPQNITAAGSLTSNMVKCRGAKAVYFMVRSTTDADTFAAASSFNLRYRADDQSAIVEGGHSLLTLTGNTLLDGAVGTVGALIRVIPIGPAEGGRLGHNALGCRVVAGAAAIDNVQIDAFVMWD